MATYHPLVSRTCGGDELEVQSGGVIEINSGGALSINGTNAVTTGGAIYAPAGFKESVQVMTSSEGVLTGYGFSVIKSSGGTLVTHSIAPVLGYVKYISCPNASATTGAARVTTTGTWDGTNNTLVFSSGNTNPQCVIAIGRSTALWTIVAKTTDVTFASV